MLSLAVALRFLRRSPTQSVFIVGGIAVGIGVQIFVGSLITSLQSSLIDQTIGHRPQVVVQAAREGGSVTYDTALRRALRRQAGIVAIAPTRAFSGIYRAGSESAPVQFTGGELRDLDTIYDISGRTVSGVARLGTDDVLVGKDFADVHGLTPGEAARFVLPDGGTARLTVAGIFDFGSAAANSSTAFVAGDRAATVLGQKRDEYSAIDTRIDDVFASQKIAASLRETPAVHGYRVTEWQVENADLLSALRSQSSSSYMIQSFVLIAVALGIASTLAVSAVQKTRQIGILKAMGMSDREAGRIFLWEALILGGAGAGMGLVAGLGLIALFTYLGRGSESLFPITPQVGFVAVSFVVGMAVAAASSLIPSRRTAKLDPIEVIQNG